MSTTTINPVETTIEKVEKIEVPVPAEIVTLEISEKKDAAVLTIAENDAQAYGQLLLLTKAAKILNL